MRTTPIASSPGPLPGGSSVNLQAQKAAMTGQEGAHTNRPELVAIHGYDTKYAMHAPRLGCKAWSF